MAENENILENDVQPQENKGPSKGQKFLAGVKEWFRKKIVALKRAPQRIPLFFTVIVSFIHLIMLFTYSKAVSSSGTVSWTGIAIFVNTLLSILVLALFLSAFPKNKKPKLVFVGMLFVFFVLIILCDVLYYCQESSFLKVQPDSFFEGKAFLNKSLTLAIVHMVLVGISIVLLATLPLYKKLILKINTRKVIESNNLKEEIDTSAEV